MIKMIFSMCDCLPVPPNHENPQSAVCDKMIRLFCYVSNLQIFPTGYCFTVSFATHQKVLAVSCCQECVLCVWQSLKKRAHMIVRIKVILDVILCHQASSPHILKDCSALTLKMKASSFEALGGTWPVTQSHPRRHWSCESPIVRRIMMIILTGCVYLIQDIHSLDWSLTRTDFIAWQFVLKMLHVHIAKCSWCAYHTHSPQNGTGSYS